MLKPLELKVKVYDFIVVFNLSVLFCESYNI